MKKIKKLGLYGGLHGQVALETLIVVGFILVLMIPLLHTLYTKTIAIQNELKVYEAERVVDTLASSISTVGVIGPNGSAEIEFSLPDSAELKIGEDTSNKEISLELETYLGRIDIVRVLSYTISGEIKTQTAGDKRVKITHYEDGSIKVSSV